MTSGKWIVSSFLLICLKTYYRTLTNNAKDHFLFPSVYTLTCMTPTFDFVKLSPSSHCDLQAPTGAPRTIHFSKSMQGQAGIPSLLQVLAIMFVCTDYLLLFGERFPFYHITVHCVIHFKHNLKKQAIQGFNP